MGRRGSGVRHSSSGFYLAKSNRVSQDRPIDIMSMELMIDNGRIAVRERLGFKSATELEAIEQPEGVLGERWFRWP